MRAPNHIFEVTISNYMIKTGSVYSYKIAKDKHQNFHSTNVCSYFGPRNAPQYLSGLNLSHMPSATTISMGVHGTHICCPQLYIRLKGHGFWDSEFRGG